MKSTEYHNGCIGCEFSQGIRVPTGGIIELSGNWLLNIYSGDESFLGWMALYPRYHRMELDELSPDEAKSLGPNIQAVDRALQSYWTLRFTDDKLERNYILYFFDSIYGGRGVHEKSETAHLHFHVIPRPKSIGSLLRSYSTDDSIHAWSIYKVYKKWNFPERYKKSKTNEQNVTDLVAFLRENLGNSTAH